MPIPNSISVNQLQRLIGTPNCPLIVDIRLPEDFNEYPRLIPGAIQRIFLETDAIAQDFPQQRMVLYCQKGLKISQGAAAVLRLQGINAEFLVGGMVAWRDANSPTVIASNIPRKSNNSSTYWVTRHRPKIDRIACPWLIRRFIDPFAKFLFVDPSQVLDVAERFSAIPFDVEGVEFSHLGKNCSFDAMLVKFGLTSNEPLETLANIIRGADTNRHEIAPEAAGLLAVSVGLSRMHRDDLRMLENGMHIYDALYRWARDAQDEGHDWPASQTTSVQS